MDKPAELLSSMQAFNRTAALNAYYGIEIVQVEPGVAQLSMPWRPEAGQYHGYLHAALIGGLIDTACGCAAGSLAGPVMASHFSVNCLRPAVGERFVAEARVVKAGRSVVFTTAELYAETGDKRTLVATGDTLLNVIAAPATA